MIYKYPIAYKNKFSNYLIRLALFVFVFCFSTYTHPIFDKHPQSVQTEWFESDISSVYSYDFQSFDAYEAYFEDDLFARYFQLALKDYNRKIKSYLKVFSKEYIAPQLLIVFLSHNKLLHSDNKDQINS